MREALAERVVALKQRLGEDRETSRRYRPFWTPTLYFLDPDGNALVTWPGLIPPEEMLALIEYGAAQVSMRRGRFDEAVRLLEGVAEAWPESAFAPEALYWAGNVRYVKDGDRSSLDRSREALAARYPESPAARRI